MVLPLEMRVVANVQRDVVVVDRILYKPMISLKVLRPLFFPAQIAIGHYH
jgi:hypothetical protein